MRHTTHMNTTRPTQHIINNSDIALTECGLLAYGVDPQANGPFRVGSQEDIASWDNEEFLTTHTSCSACHAAYMGQN
ncbi:hypothetical protein SEA_LUNA18_29 [Microbacterium phage Luna18]|nr:hypothetical protein SEA_CHEPLI_29 [Microbacterium phage Chepli]QZE10317.1 hypothetical protein SEA_KATCHAN_29 [Microbacterium phage KatChan]URQ04880.1 hypothetical protein SEA_LUNA18_29 [Microbacterium phage Luna18]